MPSELHKSQVREILEEIDDDGVGLTDWEIDYIDKMMKTACFTPKMTQKIIEIYNERVLIPQDRGMEPWMKEVEA